MESGLQEKLQGLLSDPESMQQISELAQMLQGGMPQESAPAPAGLPDAAMLAKLGELMQSGGTEDKNTALLQALRPHLSAARQERADKALRLLRMWTVFQTMQRSGMLKELF